MTTNYDHPALAIIANAAAQIYAPPIASRGDVSTPFGAAGAVYEENGPQTPFAGGALADLAGVTGAAGSVSTVR